MARIRGAPKPPKPNLGEYVQRMSGGGPVTRSQTHNASQPMDDDAMVEDTTSVVAYSTLHPFYYAFQEALANW